MKIFCYRCKEAQSIELKQQSIPLIKFMKMDPSLEYSDLMGLKSNSSEKITNLFTEIDDEISKIRSSFDEEIDAVKTDIIQEVQKFIGEEIVIETTLEELDLSHKRYSQSDEENNEKNNFKLLKEYVDKFSVLKRFKTNILMLSNRPAKNFDEIRARFLKKLRENINFYKTFLLTELTEDLDYTSILQSWDLQNEQEESQNDDTIDFMKKIKDYIRNLRGDHEQQIYELRNKLKAIDVDEKKISSNERIIELENDMVNYMLQIRELNAKILIKEKECEEIKQVLAKGSDEDLIILLKKEKATLKISNDKLRNEVKKRDEEVIKLRISLDECIRKNRMQEKSVIREKQLEKKVKELEEVCKGYQIQVEQFRGLVEMQDNKLTEYHNLSESEDLYKIDEPMPEEKFNDHESVISEISDETSKEKMKLQVLVRNALKMKNNLSEKDKEISKIQANHDQVIRQYNTQLQNLTKQVMELTEREASYVQQIKSLRKAEPE